MRFVQSSQRRRCANSCSRMTLRSSGGSSCNAQAGSTIARLKKPMAAGTRTHSDVAIDRRTRRLHPTVFRTAGSRSAAMIGVQLRRNWRRRQSPAAKRTIAAPTPRAQARKTKSAQRPGMVIAGRTLPSLTSPTLGDIPVAISIRPSPRPPSTGSAATVSNARNQTANRVPEFCLRNTRSNAQAKSATRNPSGSALRIRSIEIAPRSAGEASSFRVAPHRALLNRALLHRVPLHQHLPQATDFLRPDALVLEEVQDELLLRILEKATREAPDFRARCLFCPTSGV